MPCNNKHCGDREEEEESESRVFIAYSEICCRNLSPVRFAAAMIWDGTPCGELMGLLLLRRSCPMCLAHCCCCRSTTESGFLVLLLLLSSVTLPYNLGSEILF